MRSIMIDVGVSHGTREIEVQLGAERRELLRQQRRRTAEPHLGAERAQAVEVRARDARVEDVADDGHRQARRSAACAGGS